MRISGMLHEYINPDLNNIHIKGECAFIIFDDLLDQLEDLICDEIEQVLQSPYGHLIKELNPNFQVPKRPFKRMNYSDAIEYLKQNNITKEDDSFYEFGEDIPEMPERKMTDAINEPIMLCCFPAEIKSFYQLNATLPRGQTLNGIC